MTKDHIQQMRASLEKRLANPNLTAEQRAMLQAQYDYVVENVKEREGSDGLASQYILGS